VKALFLDVSFLRQTPCHWSFVTHNSTVLPLWTLSFRLILKCRRKYPPSHNARTVGLKYVSTANVWCSTDQSSMATEMLWVSLDGRSRINSPRHRFHSQLCCQIVRYFYRTLYIYIYIYIYTYIHTYSYVYWTLHHLDSWITTDHLGVTCFIISLFAAQQGSNVSTSIYRRLRLIVDLFNVLYCSGSMYAGVTVWLGWGGVVSLCRLKPIFILHAYIHVVILFAVQGLRLAVFNRSTREYIFPTSISTWRRHIQHKKRCGI
jgi:hypothetical protein